MWDCTRTSSDEPHCLQDPSTKSSMVGSKNELGRSSWELKHVELTSSPGPAAACEGLWKGKNHIGALHFATSQSPGTGKLFWHFRSKDGPWTSVPLLAWKDKCISSVLLWQIRHREANTIRTSTWAGVEKNACGVDAGYYKLWSYLEDWNLI